MKIIPDSARSLCAGTTPMNGGRYWGEIALLKPDLVILDGIKDLCRNIMDNL